MNEVAKAVLKQAIAITDEDLAKVSPHVKKRAANTGDMLKWRLVAEVTSSKYCFGQLKVGDKIVFDLFVNPHESTCPLCPMALGPLTTAWMVAIDRLVEGGDPNDMAWGNVRCMDPGLEHGGLGGVTFNLYAEKREGQVT